MDDLISKLSDLRSQYNCFDESERDAYGVLSEAIKALSAQPETHEERTETHGVCLDTISRQAAIDALNMADDKGEIRTILDVIDVLRELPAVELPKWFCEIKEAYDRAVKNPYIRKPLSRALYEVWHRYDQTEMERR